MPKIDGTTNSFPALPPPYEDSAAPAEASATVSPSDPSSDKDQTSPSLQETRDRIDGCREDIARTNALQETTNASMPDIDERFAEIEALNREFHASIAEFDEQIAACDAQLSAYKAEVAKATKVVRTQHPATSAPTEAIPSGKVFGEHIKDKSHKIVKLSTSDRGSEDKEPVHRSDLHPIYADTVTFKDDFFARETLKAIDLSAEDSDNKPLPSVSLQLPEWGERSATSATDERPADPVAKVEKVAAATPSTVRVKSDSLIRSRLKHGKATRRMINLLQKYKRQSQKDPFIEMPLELYNALEIERSKR